jgi:hypothetical protein
VMERTTTVQVTLSTAERLKNLKKKNPDIDASSINDVIKWLLDKDLDQGDADDDAGMEEEEAQAPQKKGNRTFGLLCTRSKFSLTAKACCTTSLDLSVPRSICW